MTLREYQKLNKIIQQGLKELELEAIRKGVLFSLQHEKAILEVKKRILERAGFSLEEYLKIEEMDEGRQNLDKKSIYLLLEETKSQLLKRIPTEKDIKGIADIVAQQYIKPPQIINKIVKEIIKEKLITVKEYDNTPIDELKKDLLFLQNDYAENFGKIPRQHSDLLAITPDDHHQEIHSIMYHLGDEYLKRLKDLLEGKEIKSSGQSMVGGMMLNIRWIEETPSGDIDGINKTFTLSKRPATNSLFLFRNGQFLTGGETDYTLSGLTLTLKVAPKSGNILTVKYTRAL